MYKDNVMQKELEKMTKIIAESLIDRERENVYSVIYKLTLTIIMLMFILTLLIGYIYIHLNEGITPKVKYISKENTSQVNSHTASLKSKTKESITVSDDTICFNTNNEKIIKVMRRGNYLWTYKSYHTPDELVYITTAKRVIKHKE